MYIRLSGLAVPACSAILSFLDDKSVLLGVSLAICYKDNLILHIISFCNGYKFYSQLHLLNSGNTKISLSFIHAVQFCFFVFWTTLDCSWT